MDIHKAYQTLQADPTDSDSSIASRFEIQHNQLKSKINLAPNEHLKEKFTAALQDVEIAYAKVIRHRSGKDEESTDQLPITNDHIENNMSSNDKEEGSPSKTLKKELEKLTKNFKYAFFACVLFLSTTVYFMIQYKNINKAYEKVLQSIKNLAPTKQHLPRGVN